MGNEGTRRTCREMRHGHRDHRSGLLLGVSVHSYTCTLKCKSWYFCHTSKGSVVKLYGFPWEKKKQQNKRRPINLHNLKDTKFRRTNRAINLN